jgi:hypothetical protein
MKIELAFDVINIFCTNLTGEMYYVIWLYVLWSVIFYNDIFEILFIYFFNITLSYFANWFVI